MWSAKYLYQPLPPPRALGCPLGHAVEVVHLRRFGLADGLGITSVLVALAWLPGSADPLTYIKLLMLFGGGLAIAPAVIMRRKQLGRPS